MALKLTNNASSILVNTIASTDTSIVITTGSGIKFPTMITGDYFYASLQDAAGNYEIVKVTARSTDSLTIVRGQEGTTARAFTAATTAFTLTLTVQTFIDYATTAVGDLPIALAIALG